MAHTEKCRGCVYENRCDYITCEIQHLAEVRADERKKAIDEFMEVVKATYHNFCGFDLERMTKYENENASQLEQSYSTMMMYEIASEFDDLIDALEQLKAGGKDESKV